MQCFESSISILLESGGLMGRGSNFTAKVYAITMAVEEFIKYDGEPENYTIFSDS